MRRDTRTERSYYASSTCDVVKTHNRKMPHSMFVKLLAVQAPYAKEQTGEHCPAIDLSVTVIFARKSGTNVIKHIALGVCEDLYTVCRVFWGIGGESI